MDEDKHMGLIRMYLQNPNGLGKSKYDAENMGALNDLDALRVDVVGLPETNTNWNNPYEKRGWVTMVKKVWPKAMVLTSSMKDGDRTTTYKPGGVCMILRCRYASMVTDRGSDKQGRWVWATLEGKDKQLMTIITFYRPCVDTKDSAGMTTAWRQQYNHQVSRAVDEGEKQSEIDSIDPRDRAIRDMAEFIHKKKINGHKIVLMGDMNKDAYQTSRTKMTYGKMCDQEKIFSGLFNHEDELKPSYQRGRKVIDHIGMSSIQTRNIVKAGQLPHGMGFSNSDHRGLFVDLDYRDEMKVTVEEIATRENRRLVSKNKKWTAVYTKEMLEQYQHHDLYNRTTKLWNNAKGGKITPRQQKKYECVDKLITEIMLGAEKKLPRKNKRGWSPKQTKIAHTIRHLRLVRRRIQGINVSERAIETMRIRAGTTFHSNDITEVQAALKTAWKEL